MWTGGCRSGCPGVIILLLHQRGLHHLLNWNSIPVRRGCEEFGACRPRFKSASSFYFICDHGVQLINLILSFSVKIRGLINSRITERIKWKCAKFLAWCECSDYSTIKFLSLSLSPNFSSLLLHQQWNSRTMSVSAGQGGESWKCQKETYKTLNVSIYSFKPNENLAMPFRMCLGKLYSYLASWVSPCLFSHPLLYSHNALEGSFCNTTYMTCHAPA